MNFWHFTPIAILYFTAATIAFALSVVVWKMKDVNGKKYFRYLTFFSGIWTLSYTLMFFSTNAQFKLIILRFEYLGVICAAVSWLFFVLSYTHNDKWLTNRMKILILIIPGITFLQILTFQHHNFYYESFRFIESEGFLISEKDYGPGFYLWIFYSYLLMISGGFILVRSVMKIPARFKRQSLPIIFSIFIILLPNFLYIIGENPLAPHDPTCLSFVIVGILFFIMIYFDKFLNIVPVAYNLVFRSTKSGVIIINDNGLILDVNPAAEELFDVHQNEMIGQNILSYVGEFEDVSQNLLKDKDYSTELEFTEKNLYYELITASLKDYKKRIIGRILVFYNITKRKQVLFELDAYARTVAHDLKSPMNSTLGFAQLLKESDNLNEEEMMYCDYIYDGINKMTDIIDGLLLLAQVRNQKEIKITPVNMKRIIERVFYRLESLIDSSKAKFEISSPWPDALGYPIWIEEVWVNYISNAIKYGGNPPVIQLGASELDDSVKFWVKDNGQGLTQEDIDSLFKEFSRLQHDKSKIKGYGLGLSIVERIVKKLGGKVGVESSDEQGSCFYFTLPKVM